jgi:hypothetical protein
MALRGPRRSGSVEEATRFVLPQGRGLHPARGASDYANEIGGCDEGRPEDVAPLATIASLYSCRRKSLDTMARDGGADSSSVVRRLKSGGASARVKNMEREVFLDGESRDGMRLLRRWKGWF